MERNIYIPLSGDSNSFFNRLSDYVKRFDSNWENIIQGTSSDKIEKYLELATQNNEQLIIPEEYIIYLEKMGENDGGLLGDFIKGSTNINLLIACYENMSEFSAYGDEITEFYDENTISHLRIGYNVETETDIFLKYCSNSEYEISKTVSVNPKYQEFNWFSSTFEKLLFQSVLFRYIGTTKKWVKKCVVSSNCFKENNVIDATKIMQQLDEVCRKYGMLKVWISDKYNYVAGNDIGIVYMKLDFNLYGNVWSDDEQFAIELSNRIMHIRDSCEMNNNTLLKPENTIK